MQSVEEADHSHYGAGKGGKALPRPYCDHCEGEGWEKLHLLEGGYESGVTGN
jgi:hypothetical protein